MEKEKLIEYGIISKIDGTNIEVVLNSNDNCEECTAKLFCKPTTENENILTIESNQKLEIGDSVEVAISGRTILISTFLLYGLPLLLLIILILFGMYLFQNSNYSELYSFAMGISVLAIYYSLFNTIMKRNSKLFRHPILTKIYSSN